MRISDWSSDVCSSDLLPRKPGPAFPDLRPENPARFSGQPPGAWRVAGLGLGADLGDRRRSSKASDGDQSAWPLRGLQSELRQLRSEAVSVGAPAEFARGEIGREPGRERRGQYV